MQSMQFTVPYNLHQALKFIKHKSKQGMGKVVLATSYFVSFHTKKPNNFIAECTEIITLDQINDASNPVKN